MMVSCHEMMISCHEMTILCHDMTICFFGSVDIPWGIIELVLWRTALQADTYVFGFIRAHLHFVPMYTGYSW